MLANARASSVGRGVRVPGSVLYRTFSFDCGVRALIGINSKSTPYLYQPPRRRHQKNIPKPSSNHEGPYIGTLEFRSITAFLCRYSSGSSYVLHRCMDL